MPPRRVVAWSIPAVTGLALLAAACSDTLGLPRALTENVIDTVSLYALDGTSVSLPSAYHIETRNVVRTDRTPVFDFVFNIDSQGQPVFLPTGAVGLGEGSGLQVVATPFDSIKIAPGSGYMLDSAVAADSGAVLLARSRLTTCNFGANVFFYAKLQVLTVDAAARRIDFKILVDSNCGYRGLEPGLPRR
ncbi:MAG: hypothetical protein HYS40_02320 [Gemmatimonadetes bacterium]|nr:hypothetical protein [Gemmatimonadota bacterium]